MPKQKTRKQLLTEYNKTLKKIEAIKKRGLRIITPKERKENWDALVKESRYLNKQYKIEQAKAKRLKRKLYNK